MDAPQAMDITSHRFGLDELGFQSSVYVQNLSPFSRRFVSIKPNHQRRKVTGRLNPSKHLISYLRSEEMRDDLLCDEVEYSPKSSYQATRDDLLCNELEFSPKPRYEETRDDLLWDESEAHRKPRYQEMGDDLLCDELENFPKLRYQTT